MLGLGDMNADQLASKLEETLPVIRSVSEQFKDPVSCSYKPSTLPLPHTLCSAGLSKGTEFVSVPACRGSAALYVLLREFGYHL